MLRDHSQVATKLIPLWELAERLTPKKEAPCYNQAIMDLGAMICTPKGPACHRCPLNKNCQAYALNRMMDFPQKKKTKANKPIQTTQMLIIQNELRHVLLEKRPPVGIWGGLWSFPQCAVSENPVDWCHKNYSLKVKVKDENYEKIVHTFSHFSLHIHPIVLITNSENLTMLQEGLHIWYNPAEAIPGGIPAPLTKLLNKLYDD